MLKKRDRLKRQEFTTLLSKGRRVHGAHVSLVYLSSDKGKCGVVVSKKTARQAVARHLLRRRVYRILGESSKNWRETYHISILLRPSATTLSYQTLSEEIASLLARLP